VQLGGIKLKRHILSCFAALIAIILLDSCKAALLIAPDNSILYVTVNPSHIPIGGTSAVKVMGYKPSGTTLPNGTVIFFSCDTGSIDSQVETNNGVAIATFRSDGNRSGVANIFVRSGNAQMSPDTVTITIGGAALNSLSLSADPQVLPVGGGIARIFINAYDENLNSLSDIPITLTTDAGQLNSSGNTLYTNAGGKAEDILQTNTTANVTATSGTITTQITITVESNENPTASFVYSPTNPIVGQKVNFNAAGSSDGDGYIVSYEWNFGDGRTDSGQNTTHKYKQAGSYNVVLVVTDNNGNTGSATKSVTVGDNESPTASFVYSPTSPGIDETVYFNASGSYDPDGEIVGYEWDFGDGSTGSGETITHRYKNAGTYTVLMKVTDDSENTGSASKTITISEGQSPIASFVYSPTSPGVGETVYFNASDSKDPDGEIVSYEWNFGDGATGSGETITHQFTSAGTYAVFLKVTDNSGNTGNTSKTITVSSGQNPTASFIYSPTSPKVGEPIYFNASDSSDPDGSVVDFQWDMGDGTTRTGEKITHTYANAGTYTVFLVVTDNSGNTGSTGKTVTVTDNQKPIASFVYSPSNPKAGENVYFNASNSSDPDGTITSYQWDFGDGNPGTGVNSTHSYKSAGTYTIVLVVTDDSGNQTGTSQSIIITN
jgi:PKD repeat protein